MLCILWCSCRLRSVSLLYKYSQSREYGGISRAAGKGTSSRVKTGEIVWKQGPTNFNFKYFSSIPDLEAVTRSLS